MDTADDKIVNNYFGLLSKLSVKLRLDLIERLKQSVKVESAETSRIKHSFGAWQSSESAEEVTRKIESSRLANRQLEEF